MDSFASLPCLFCQRMAFWDASFDQFGLAKCPLCGQVTLFTSERLSDVVQKDSPHPSLSLAVLDVFARHVFGMQSGGAELAARRHGFECTGGDNGCMVVIWLPDQIITSAQAAEILGVSTDWVGRLATQGRFPNARRGVPTKRQYRSGQWRIPLGDVRAVLVEDQERPALTAPSRLASADAGALVDALMRFDHSLGHRTNEGLAHPSIALDMLMIANARAGNASSVIRIPSIKCSPRAYLLDEQGNSLAILTGALVSPWSVNALIVAAQRITGVADPYGLHQRQYELWLLKDDRATQLNMNSILHERRIGGVSPGSRSGNKPQPRRSRRSQATRK